MYLLRKRYLSVLVAAALLAAIGCRARNQAAGANQQGGPPAVEVSVIEVQPEAVPIYGEFVSETYARDQVEVRGRVTGYIERRLFQPGSEVRAGQVLYVLDQRPYAAAVARARGGTAESQANLVFAQEQVQLIEAEAQLAQAEAELIKAKQDVARLVPLVKEEAAAQQDLDNAVAAERAAQANYNARKANVEQSRLTTKTRIETAQANLQSSQATLQEAELNLGYATIRAQISGRIGDSRIEVGGLVTQASEQPLTTIVPLDPIWVRFQVSENQLLDYQRRQAERSTDPTQLKLQLTLSDGTTHPYPGRYMHALNQIDPKTGTLQLQATFPNPRRTLLPGQFGQLRIKLREQPGALLVPQRAIQELQSMRSVFTVGEDNKVVARTVMTGDRIESRVIVEQGLKPGDRVVVDGLQKIRPGAVIKPKLVPAADPAEGAKGEN